MIQITKYDPEQISSYSTEDVFQAQSALDGFDDGKSEQLMLIHNFTEEMQMVK